MLFQVNCTFGISHKNAHPVPQGKKFPDYFPSHKSSAAGDENHKGESLPLFVQSCIMNLYGKIKASDLGSGIKWKHLVTLDKLGMTEFERIFTKKFRFN
jgi:hypothetical protein